MANNLNLAKWKQYPDLLTDSLWVFDQRDSSGVHLPWYWGNFVPQIPQQLMRRFTCAGDWVIDPFLGSGTTLIECRRWGRNGLGVELNPQVAAQAATQIAEQENPHNVVTAVAVGDSTALDFAALLRKHGGPAAQLLLLHPPYWDIIKFSDHAQDLSQAATLTDFLALFHQVVTQTFPVLAPEGHMAVVIGDKYVRGEWVPLGFYLLGEVLQHGGYTLKAIIVKNFNETKGKQGQRSLWRYRALRHGLYEFKHEYILLFQKRPSRHASRPAWLQHPPL